MTSMIQKINAPSQQKTGIKTVRKTKIQYNEDLVGRYSLAFSINH